jgi:hypothetical protein
MGTITGIYNIGASDILWVMLRKTTYSVSNIGDATSK